MYFRIDFGLDLVILGLDLKKTIMNSQNATLVLVKRIILGRVAIGSWCKMVR
jgi:hypothetical protein